MVMGKVRNRIERQIFMVLILLSLWANAGFCQQWEITPLIGYGVEGEFEERQSGQTFELSDDTVNALAINYASAQDQGSQSMLEEMCFSASVQFWINNKVLRA
jgi:hypothetical protein